MRHWPSRIESMVIAWEGGGVYRVAADEGASEAALLVHFRHSPMP